MTTRHLVDPDLLSLIDSVSPIAFDSLSIAEIRALAEHQYSGSSVDPPPTIMAIPACHDRVDIEGLLFNPKIPTPDKGAIIYLHGGGMVMGSAQMFGAACAAMASAFDVPVIAPNYRLAPEHPFPTPLEDCYSTLCWFEKNSKNLGFDPDRIVVVGESAGGNLAAALGVMTRDRGGPFIAGQALISPMLDHRTGGIECPYRNPSTGEFIWTRENNRFCWEAFRGGYDLQDHRKGWFSPILADDFSSLPPTFLATGSLDLFFDETLSFARNLSAHGIPVELHCYAGAVHGFNMARGAAVTKRYSRELMQGLSRLLGRGVCQS